MTLRFGSFELDEKRFELRRDGILVDVQPRALETLLFLIKHRHRLVTKKDLLAGPWKGMTVAETALSQAIRQARTALGDDPKTPQFIQTVRGKGFRFRGELRSAPSSRDSAPSSRRLRPLFGRQQETDRLHLAANEARAGHGNVVLLHGPPGIGKTRLAQWFATHQREAGSEVCWGGCREGQSAPPLWPWPEVLNRYTETRDASVIERLARDLEQDLAAVAPELREALGAASASIADESRERAQSVLVAIGSFLRRAAGQAPLTLVLEDLHLADDDALQLLEIIARSIADTQLMVLGTFRRAEGASRPVLAAVGEGSLPHLQGLALDGLSLHDVREWLASAIPTPLPEPVAETLHFSTEGLPLLVEAIVDDLPTWNATLLAGDGNDRILPRGRVNEILGKRLQQLDEPTLQLLRTAAVFGEEFPIATLGAVAHEPLNALLLRLEQAQQQGVLKPSIEGSLRFAHALHQELLYRELSTLERHELHAAIARAFADQLVQQPDAIVQTAYHFLEALPHADLDATVFYAQKAAEWARMKHAYPRAAEYYRRALEVFDLRPTNPKQYAELLLALGQTQCVAGSVNSAIATLERVFELTRAHGHYDLFSQAIVLWFQLRQESAVIDSLFHARIAEALEHVTEKDATFAQLQIARAMALVVTAPAGDRVTWVQEALALTQGSANRRVRLDILRGALRCATRFTDGTTGLDLAEELLVLANGLKSLENELEARQWTIFYLLERGDGHEYARQIIDYAKRAAVSDTPIAAWTASMHRVGQLFLAGDLIESERLARGASVRGQELVGIVALLHLVGQLYQVGFELTGAARERVLTDAQAGAERILAFAPKYHALVATRLRGAMYRGQMSDAESYLAAMKAPTYAPPDPLDQNCLCTLACIADMAVEIGHTEAAAIVLQQLRAYAGSHAVSANGSIYFGLASYWLGRLCLTLGRQAEAIGYLKESWREAQQSGSLTYLAWSEYYLAQALPADDASASGLLESSKRAAHRYGMQRLLTKFDETEA